MSGSVNRVILLGNLTKDPEIRTLSDNKEIASLNLATSESWKAKDGSQKERTEYHRVVVFNTHLVALVKKFAKKGSRLFIEGSIQTRKYLGKDGKETYTTEIVLQPFSGNVQLLDSKQERIDEDDDYNNIPY